MILARSGRRLSCALAALPLCLFAIAAQARAPAGGSLAERYESALQVLKKRQGDEEKTRADRDRLATEARSLQERLIENAAKVQELEQAYADTQAELVRLRERKAVIEADFLKDRDKIAQLLAVLQRLDADRPPALAIRPEDPLAAARGTMLIGTMLPPVYDQASALSRQLKLLADTTAAVAKSAAQAQSEAKALQEARAELTGLLAMKSREATAADAKLEELHGLTEQIARQTNGLKSLIDRIAGLRAAADDSSGMTVVGPRHVDLSLRRGSLRPPVIGTMMRGDPAGPGRTPGSAPSGLWFVGEGGSEAVAPSDSEVVFSGPYQKFGQVLILEIAGGYHLTLAGLGRVDVRIGDRVLAGEPVGSLPEGNTARLYLELRRNGQTVDPAPWMSAELRKAKGT